MKIADRYENSIVVSKEMLANAVGSGEVDVFATPMMIALMENTAAKCVADSLEEGQTTVGTSINVTHCAATPVGMKVTCEAIVMEIDKRTIIFHVSASDECGIIGGGTHTRVIVDKDRFEKKAASKLQKD